eukprot:6212144-Pleurochrysis_carterae.AAC.2
MANTSAKSTKASDWHAWSMETTAPPLAQGVQESEAVKALIQVANQPQGLHMYRAWMKTCPGKEALDKVTLQQGHTCLSVPLDKPLAGNASCGGRPAPCLPKASPVSRVQLACTA